MIAILGAGSGGLALASYLKDRKIDFTIWDRSIDKIKQLKKDNNILTINGPEIDSKKGLQLDCLTNDLKSTIENNKYFFIITPGIAHEDIPEKIKNYISEKKVFILMPGRTYGGVAFKERLGDAKKFVDVYETQTILHASRLKENILDIFGEKKDIYYSAFEGSNEEDKEFLKKIIPKMEYVDNYYTVTLNNVGAMLHPLPAVLNISRIEHKEPYFHYGKGISPLISNFIEGMDQERKKICEVLGAKFISTHYWLELEYGSKGRDLYESIQNNNSYSKIKGPEDIKHRYIFDDLITGLVPLYKTAVKHHICVKKIEAFLKFASFLFNYDFIEEGRDCL